jgi:hypothetical protein
MLAHAPSPPRSVPVAPRRLAARLAPRARLRGAAALGIAALVGLVGCGEPGVRALPDAPPDPDAPPADAGPDAAPCADATLFTGGTAHAAQGWQVYQQGAASLGFSDPQTTFLRTATQGATSGQLLLARPGTLVAGKPFVLEVVLRVVSVSPHNQFDAAAAILVGLTPPFGTPTERAQMIYLDPRSVGWADDSQSAIVDNLDGAFHTYRLAVSATGAAQLSRDGAPLLSRTRLEVTGAIAIGDQTNDPGLDAELQIRSVALRCP